MEDPETDERYLVEVTVLDTQVGVEHDGGLEPKAVATGRFFYSTEGNYDECVCDVIRESIDHYQEEHIDAPDS